MKNVSYHSLMNKTLSTKHITSLYLAVVFLILCSTATRAQNYPFTLPENISASLDVNTKKVEVVKNNLMGYNYWDFKDSDDKALFWKLDPISVRWSEGNNYDWQTDGFLNDDYDNFEHESVLETQVRAKMKHGFPELVNMYKAQQTQNGRGFDALWNWSVGFKDTQSNLDRIVYYENQGVPVTDLEIGNEYFWKIFRSYSTADEDKQLVLFRELADAVHEFRPNIRLSIPLGWRSNQEDYNRTIIDDNQYYDAISIHKYLGADPDVAEESDLAYSTILTSRLLLQKDINFVRNQAPGKPVWLTEWSVAGGGKGEWAAALGSVDTYLYMFENQDIYDRACWFSVSGLLNSFLVMDPPPIRAPKLPLQKTNYGSMYGIVRSVFEDAQMYEGTMTTSQLTTDLGTTNAVNARVVNKDGDTKVLAVNLTNKTVEFELKFDGVAYTNSFTHEAMTVNNLDDTGSMPIDDNPLSLVKTGTGTITLPPLSINVISNIVIDPLEAYFVSPHNGDVTPGSNLRIEAGLNVDAATIASMALYVDGNLVSIKTAAPFLWNTEEALKDIDPGTHDLKLVITNTDAKVSEMVRTIDVPTYSYFTSPTDNQRIKAHDIQVMAALNAHPVDIANIELQIDDQTVRTITAAPFKWGIEKSLDAALKNLQEGNHVLKLITTSISGKNISNSITITIEHPLLREPYGAAPTSLPGTLEAENYDKGSEGVGYHDSSDGNKNGIYRSDDVDIGSVPSGGYCVSDVSGGEWLTYTVDAKKAGLYNIEIVYASKLNIGMIGMELLDENEENIIFSDFALPQTSTENWTTYASVSKNDIPLKEGKNVIRLNIISRAFNIDKIIFTKEGYVVVEPEPEPDPELEPNPEPNPIDPVGIDLLQQENLVVYPNPSIDGRYKISKPTYWQIYNLSGVLLKSSSSDSFDISNFGKGIYIYKSDKKVIKLVNY